MRLVWSCAVGTAMVSALLLGPALAQGQLKRQPAPKGAQVYFEYPPNGATVTPRITVRAGLHHMGIAPVGEAIPNTGHHHLLIDTELRNLNEPIPVNNNIIHFSNGETEVAVTLPPGKHTLRLVLGDANHMNFDPPIMSNQITVEVRAHEPAAHAAVRTPPAHAGK